MMRYLFVLWMWLIPPVFALGAEQPLLRTYAEIT